MMKNQLWTALVGVSTSIVGSVLYANFADSTKNEAVNILESMSRLFRYSAIDSPYGQASLGPTNAMVFQALLYIRLFYIIAAGLSAFYFFFRFIDSGQNSRQNIESGKRINLLITNLTRSRIANGILLVNGILGVLFSLMSVSSSFVTLQAYATFDRRIRAISAFADDSQVKELVGEWASMNTKAEYEKINSEIENIASIHNRKLPDRLI